MKEVVGVQFKHSSRLYYFSPNGEHFVVGDHVIVETVRGMELGQIIIANRQMEDDDVQYELKPIIKKASHYDVKKENDLAIKATKNFERFKVIVSEMNLDMKPLYSEYTIDGSKLLFYYTSEDRVDFRDLLKVLASEFKVRIELRQIGAREAARVVGGVGVCGRVICCKSCLNNFDYVTMKMAKDQGMSLNTSKINGTCGKLLCCIGYEHEMYLEMKKELPDIGELVKTPNEIGKVVDIDYMKKIISVNTGEEGKIARYPSSEISSLHPKNPSIDEGVEQVDSVDAEKETEETQNSSEPSDNNNGKPKNKYQKIYQANFNKNKKKK